MAYFNFKNGQTPINDTNLNAMQKGLMELVYPIGSTYITQDKTNPNTILGFGTWERFDGLLAVGIKEENSEFNKIGKEVGEEKHTLTTNEMPSHNHQGIFTYDNINQITNNAVQSGDGFQALSISSSNGHDIRPPSAGGNQSHNNIQPTKVVGYMWIRRS